MTENEIHQNAVLEQRLESRMERLGDNAANLAEQHRRLNLRNLRYVVLEKQRLEGQLEELTDEYNARAETLRASIREFARLRNEISQGYDPDRLALGRQVLSVRGNPWACTDGMPFGRSIAAQAIRDLSLGCPSLRERYFGNKRYEGFYQRTDCRYGYSPVHGTIVDSVELCPDYRDRPLTDDEADAAIYYLLSLKPQTTPLP